MDPDGDDGWNVQEELERATGLCQALVGEGKDEGNEEWVALENLSTMDGRYQIALRKALASLERCKRAVEATQMFSANESVDDLTTSTLRFVLVDSMRGNLVQRRIPFPAEEEEGGKTMPEWSKERAQEALNAFENFLQLVEKYKLHVSPSQSSSDPLHLREGFKARRSPEQQRDDKIKRFRKEQELKAATDEVRARLRAERRRLRTDETATTIFEDEHEEIVREYYLSIIKLEYYKALEEMDKLELEINLLKRHIDDSIESDRVYSDTPSSQSRRAKEDGTSWRLDHTTQNLVNGPLVSQQGRPLRPFTILPARTRQDVQRQVFRPDHNLPTMSIDEYLENEARRGNVIGGGGPSEQQGGRRGELKAHDEDSDTVADQRTYEAREWDEFKDHHPKGAGNRMSNRG